MATDPILDRILHYAEIDPSLAQLALGLARLGQVIWQLERAAAAPMAPPEPPEPTGGDA